MNIAFIAILATVAGASILMFYAVFKLSES